MGFDPILSMPDLAGFSSRVLKRTCPIKALLLDQSFSAGVGNWIAGEESYAFMAAGLPDDNPDEVLYHARIHPEQRCNSLSEEQIEALHRETSNVCAFAVKVNADHLRFPDNWLFKHRWVNTKAFLFLFTSAVVLMPHERARARKGRRETARY
jgi:formamidopyrimidine-DNA glycosylase